MFLAQHLLAIQAGDSRVHRGISVSLDLCHRVLSFRRLRVVAFLAVPVSGNRARASSAAK